MFKFEEICELIRLVGSTKVASVEVEHGGTRLRIEGPAPIEAGVPMAAPSVSVVQPQAQVQPQAPAAGAQQSTPAVSDEFDGAHFVTSPIVGTFYRAPNPDAAPFVKVGDVVEKGQVLCIVEAMKLMNEIESDVSGTVLKVMPENAQPVEFGERLFAIKPE